MSDIRFNRWLHQSGTGGVSQDSSGNIGIGTTVPTEALDVRGNLSVSDTITATTGTFSGNISAVDASYTGNVTIGGTLTYEDVTNIDAVGIITARSDVHVGAGLSVVGVSTLGNTVVGGATTELIVGGDARITGILTIGTSSLTLDGTNNNITVGAGITIAGNTGIISATGGINAKLLGTPELAAISSSISDTAVDVFVYDTRKDSDGGAWRKRTQHTSWYNETLNTATRGSRREFPAVAVIVTETDRVTIYDGDDPDLPMWMVFLSGPDGANERLLRYAINAASEMLNAILCVATADTLAYISFIDEYHRLYHTGAEYYFPERTGIVDRNVIIAEPKYDGGYGLPSSDTNDVAMTVLPNAPIDSATGLPKPTIAVATENGVGVIKDDGTVVDIRGTHGGNYNQTIFVDFDSKTNAIISGFDYGAGNTNQIYKLAVFPIPSADVTDDNTLYGYQHHYRRIQTQANVTIPKLAGNYIRDAISAGGDGRYAIKTTGSGTYPTALNIFQEEPGTDGYNTTYPSNSRVAYATTSYNTGWMHGDIKGAFLSDTTVESFSATNLVSEDFSANWTGASNGVLSVSSGQLTITNSGGSNGRAQSNTFATTGGKKYAFIVKAVSNSSATYRLEVRGPELVTTGTTDGQTLVVYFNGTGNSSTFVELYAIGSSGASATYEDAYVVEIEEDRSVNNKGLQVFGTVTKSAVATGADLVSYGPFSTSNYLKQPYNSDLQWDGNATWSISFWVYFTQNQAYDQLMSREQPDGSGNRWLVETGNQNVITFKSQGSSRVQVPGDSTYGAWRHICFTQEGGLYRAYRDGVEVGTYVGSDNFYNTSAELYIGRGVNGVTDHSKLALVRISNSVPSPEQIKKIYEDEKVLFQENAACTLYGSSDTVTALAYDDSNGLLHVGTSSGRSDFQGLRRINNTTTAVTTTMSASNGLVAEQ